MALKERRRGRFPAEQPPRKIPAGEWVPIDEWFDAHGLTFDLAPVSDWEEALQRLMWEPPSRRRR